MKINPFEYSLDNKRYHTWNYFLKTKFGGKVYKVPLSLATTCPNRDGTKGFGGCSFCLSGGGGVPYKKGELKKQFEENAAALENKWPNAYTMPYFQSYSNTYTEAAKLKAALEEAAKLPKAIGVCIATRPDCLPDDIVKTLKNFSQDNFLIVELGLQTVHETTANVINRGHTWDEFLKGYNKLAQADIAVCIHIINGLPCETKEMMLQTAAKVADLNPHSIKIHMMHILKGTKLAEDYKQKPFKLLTKDEYVQIVCDQIELMPQKTVVQRVTGDPPKEELIVPDWTLNKLLVRNDIDKELSKRNSFQGFKRNHIDDRTK